MKVLLPFRTPEWNIELVHLYMHGSGAKGKVQKIGYQAKMCEGIKN